MSAPLFPKICKLLVVYRFKCMALFQSYDKLLTDQDDQNSCDRKLPYMPIFFRLG